MSDSKLKSNAIVVDRTAKTILNASLADVAPCIKLNKHSNAKANGEDIIIGSNHPYI